MFLTISLAFACLQLGTKTWRLKMSKKKPVTPKAAERIIRTSSDPEFVKRIKTGVKKKEKN